MIIPDENKALEHIYANHEAGVLYTIMCDVVAGALDKLRELKEREVSARGTLTFSTLKRLKTIWV